MNKCPSFFLLMAFLAGSCAPVTVSPTKQPTASFTQTTIPSAIPTELPSPTPIPETQERLLVTRDHKQLAVFNPDGSLQKYIEMPKDSFVGRIEHAISPDGNWVVYQTDSFDKPHELSLKLLNSRDETSFSISKLISPQFPENIEPLIETIDRYDKALYESDCYSDQNCLRSLVQDDVVFSAGSSAWSPDSRFLGFSAQIDGPSTDIYIYSMQDKVIQRFTDDFENTGRIQWSPDGRRILYVNNIPGTSVIGETIHVTDLEGKTFQASLTLPVSEAHWMQIGWISNTLYLFQALYYEHPQFRQLVVLNTETGQVSEIWPYTVDDFKVDTHNQTIVLLFESENDPTLPSSGVYRVSMDGEYEKISNQEFYRLTGSLQIVGEGLKDGVETAYHIKSDNSILPIGPALSGHSDVYASPNQKWFLIDDFYEGDQRLTIYNDTYQAITSWMIDEHLEEVSWRPDSLGLFLFSEDNVYYIDIPTGDLKQLDAEVPRMTENCTGVSCTWAWFTWRP